MLTAAVANFRNLELAIFSHVDHVTVFPSETVVKSQTGEVGVIEDSLVEELYNLNRNGMIHLLVALPFDTEAF